LNQGRSQDIEMIVEEVVRISMPTEYGIFELVAFDDKSTKKTLFALTKGSWLIDEPILVRVHSSCITGDIIGSLRCDCGPQLQAAMKKVEAAGKGVVIYIEQEGRGIGFLNKMKAYKLQEEGFDTVEANLNLGFKADQREYEVVENVTLEIDANEHNNFYLKTKRDKMGHVLFQHGLK